MELKGKTALMTSASGRLGFVIALYLAEDECSCVCNYYSNQKKRVLVEQVSKVNSITTAVIADLADQMQIEQSFEEASCFNNLQILVNCAAVFFRQSLDSIRFEDAKEKQLSLVPMRRI